jgi:hypothetical protein
MAVQCGNPRRPSSAITVNSTTGPAPSHSSRRARRSPGVRAARHTAHQSGSATHGSRYPSCPPTISSTGAGDHPPVGRARAPWNRNEAQPCVAFHQSVGSAPGSATSAASHGPRVRSCGRSAGVVSR